MRIALDAMGGDFAPAETVRGAIDFLNETSQTNVEVLLVGQEDLIRTELGHVKNPPDGLSIIHAPDLVSMNDKPAKITKTKPNSSLVKAVQLVKDGAADAIISAGSTGALLAASLFLLGRIQGVRRPALCAQMPDDSGGFLLCDVGANVDARASDLVQFAIMAQAYCTHKLKRPDPSVGIINIGTEEGKGNELTQRAHGLLRQHVENYYGYIEARDVFDGTVDVVVCDGFVGNLLLKFGEGMVSHVINWGKAALKQHPVSLLALPLMKPTLKDLATALDHEVHGGTPLLGLNSLAIVCHGSSSRRAIKNTIAGATQCVTENLIESIAAGIADHLEIFEEQNAAN